MAWFVKRRVAVALLGLGALIGLGIAAAKAYLASDGVRAAALARIESEVSERLPGARVGQYFEASLWGSVTFGPLELVGPSELGSDSARPLVSATAVVVHVAPWSLVRGDPKPSSVELLEVTLAAAGTELRLAEAELRFAQGPSGLEAKGTVTLPAGSELDIAALWTGTAADVTLHSDGLDVRDLAAHALAGHGIALLRGNLGVDLEAHATAKHAEATGNFVVRDVLVSGERVAPAPLELPRITGHARVGFAPAKKKLVIDEARLELGDDAGASIGVTGAIDLKRTGALDLAIEAKTRDFGALVAALPSALRPDRRVPLPDGGVAMAVELSGVTHAPGTWELATTLDLTDLERRARKLDTFLRGEFTHSVVDALGRTHSFVVGPSDGRFVPIDALPAHVTRAVTTSEDAGFFAHQGFDFAELKNSAVEALEPGGRVRGGSTITQQLAKNLFLTRERTLARKAREALITVALEATLTKKRLLEIYLNVIEWGPGLYGIGPAAKHYFGKHASQLTPTEAAYLASIIPNPVRYYSYFTRGALTPTWHDRVATLLGKMHTLGYLDDASHARALEAPLTFARSSGL